MKRNFTFVAWRRICLPFCSPADPMVTVTSRSCLCAELSLSVSVWPQRACVTWQRSASSVINISFRCLAVCSLVSVSRDWRLSGMFSLIAVVWEEAVVFLLLLRRRCCCRCRCCCCCCCWWWWWCWWFIAVTYFVTWHLRRLLSTPTKDFIRSPREVEKWRIYYQDKWTKTTLLSIP